MLGGVSPLQSRRFRGSLAVSHQNMGVCTATGDFAKIWLQPLDCRYGDQTDIRRTFVIWQSSGCLYGSGYSRNYSIRYVIIL